MINKTRKLHKLQYTSIINWILINILFSYIFENEKNEYAEYTGYRLWEREKSALWS